MSTPGTRALDSRSSSSPKLPIYRARHPSFAQVAIAVPISAAGQSGELSRCLVLETDTGDDGDEVDARAEPATSNGRGGG
jgi:hypothetical protein